MLKTLGTPSVVAAAAEGPCEWIHASAVPLICSVSGSKSMTQSWGHAQNDDQFETAYGTRECMTCPMQYSMPHARHFAASEHRPEP